MNTMPTREMVEEVLYNVYDPELGINIMDLGLVYEIEIEIGVVNITMTLTTPGCPMHDSISSGVRSAVEQLEGVEHVNVQIVWEPAWTPEMMSDRAKQMLYR